MSQDRLLLGLVERLIDEQEIAPPASVHSNVARHYDRATAQLIQGTDPAVVRALLARLADTRPVRRAAPPHSVVDGGYGKTFGLVTVADKARFVLERILAPELLAEAFANGPAFCDRPGRSLRWDPATKRFKF